MHLKFHPLAYLLAIYSSILQAQDLTNRLDALITQQLPQATVGIVVKEANTGRILYSKNAKKLLSPASVTKLFTAAGALYQLKPDYHFFTTLAKKDANYYLVFTGSPSLTIEELKTLLLPLKNNGIKSIKGNIVVDTSHFSLPNFSSADSYDDLGWYYTAPVSAVILNGNMAAYTLKSAEKSGLPIHLNPKSLEPKIKIINNVMTVDKTTMPYPCSLNIEVKSDNTLRLYGCWDIKRKPQTMRFALMDPLKVVESIILKTLNASGVSFKGHILQGKTPSDATIIARLPSADLIQLITHMLQESDNLYANSLFKELAYVVMGQGSFQQGALAIKHILKQYTQVDTEQIVLEDGAGGRYNLVTAEQVVVLLTDLYRDQVMQPLMFRALAQSGLSGSLKERMKHTVLEGKVYAKTGTMHDISSLSGYLFTANDRVVIFSILINGINKPIPIVKKVEEQMLILIAEDYLNKVNLH